MYQVKKRYGHSLGMSACFRQHKAASHCNRLHGYAMAFEFTIGAHTLDARNWVVDFGGFAELKMALKLLFDHTLLVAVDDPKLDEITALANDGLAMPIILPRVGCESFAEIGAILAQRILWTSRDRRDDAFLISCSAHEHGANSASYFPPPVAPLAPPYEATPMWRTNWRDVDSLFKLLSV